jgi:hypothetical protein
MAIELFASGTQAATIGTEHVLSAPNKPGTYTFHVDPVNMQAGDTLQLRTYQKVLTGGTARVAFEAEFVDAQSADDMIKISVPISNDLAEANALKFSLKQTVGTGRSYDWKVIRHF